MELKEFRVESFGAVGDGITDDGKAICAAVDAAAKDESPLRAVVFDCAKTYRVTSLPDNHPTRCLLSVENVKGIRFWGKGAKLLLTKDIRLLYARFCTDLELCGFVIDYSPKPFLLGTLTSKNESAGWMEFHTQEDLEQPCKEYDCPETYFAFPNVRDKRYHYFITHITDKGNLNYRFQIGEGTRNRIAEANEGDVFLLPLFGGSHNIGATCTVQDCDSFTLSNLRFYAHPEFGFDIRSNHGKMRVDGVAMMMQEGAPEQLVAWRDCFHVKDNTDPITFENCTIGPIGDDAFNLSCVHLDVTKVSEDGCEIHAFPAEKGETRDLLPGDEFVAYDLETGQYLGEGKVKQQIFAEHEVCFVADRPFPDLKNGMQVAFYRFANPGFVVKNCQMEGTVRVRSSGVFENCRFNVFWVRVENEWFVEGPIPRDVTFRNCVFTTPYDDSAEVFHVGTLSKGPACSYHCKNIRLEHCTFEKGHWHADEGNELIVEP